MPTPVYPSLATDVKGSTQQPESDLVIDVWPNGSARGRSYFGANIVSWTLMHGVLSDTDRQTLQTFYATNQITLFDYVSPWDGVTYHNVGFVMVPTYERLPGLYWNVRTKLRKFF